MVMKKFSVFNPSTWISFECGLAFFGLSAQLTTPILTAAALQIQLIDVALRILQAKTVGRFINMAFFCNAQWSTLIKAQDSSLLLISTQRLKRTKKGSRMNKNGIKN